MRSLQFWLARGALALAVVAAAAGVLWDLHTSRRVWRSAHRLGGEMLEESQNRVFGPEYMASIRRIQSAVGENESVFLVDAQSSDQGATYFALYALAPRRVVDLGGPRQAIRVLRRRPKAAARAVVIVRDGQTPLELTTAAEFLAR